MPRKPSLDGKDSSLRIRMSPEQKEKLVFYAERHYQTMSNVIFQALDILYAREEQQNNKEENGVILEFISSFFSTPLWHFFDNSLCKNQKIRFIRSTRENIKKRHRNIEKKIRSLASGNVLTQGFFSPERKGKKNSAVSRKRRKRKFLQVSLLKKCKVGVRRDRTYKLCILSGKLDRLKSHILPSRGMLFI